MGRLANVVAVFAPLLRDCGVHRALWIAISGQSQTGARCSPPRQLVPENLVPPSIRWILAVSQRTPAMPHGELCHSNRGVRHSRSSYALCRSCVRTEPDHSRKFVVLPVPGLTVHPYHARYDCSEGQSNDSLRAAACRHGSRWSTECPSKIRSRSIGDILGVCIGSCRRRDRGNPMITPAHELKDNLEEWLTIRQIQAVTNLHAPGVAESDLFSECCSRWTARTTMLDPRRWESE